MRQRQHRFTLALIAALAALLGCSGIQVTTDYDPEVRFTDWSRYAWAQRVASEDSDPRVESSLLRDRIERAAEAALAARGFRLVADGEAPQFQLRYHIRVDSRLQLEVVDHYYSTRREGVLYGSTQTYFNEWDESDLMLDVLDTSGERLLWRGSGISELLEDGPPEDRIERVEEVVNAILERFPPSR